MLGLFGKRLEKKKLRRIHRQYDTHIRNRDSAAEVFAMARLPEPSTFNWDLVNADVVHLHWMSFLADYPTFFGSIPNPTPIVWTLHDMNPFTGGCHYSSGCNKFQSGCGSCPQIVAPSPTDVSADSFNVKQKSLSRKNLHIVTPSRWLGELAKTSSIFPDQTTFHVIRLGFDLKEFSPIEKNEARRLLGLETNAVLLAFGAEDIRNQRKGFHHLLNSLPLLKTSAAVECLVFGSGDLPTDPLLPKMHEFGYVNSVEKQRLIYSAADIVIVPSREDNSPQVGLEAMACGTPVVGFNAGGIAEYVRDGVTGRLAELGNESELAGQISGLVDNEGLRQVMSGRARLMMEEEYELEAQTQKYVSLYRELVSHANRQAA